MTYTSIQHLGDLARANQIILNALQKQTTKIYKNKRLVFRPAALKTDVHWLERHQIWFAALEKRDHYLILTGVTHPDSRKSIRITLELNVPKKPDHGRAGLLLRTNPNQLFLAHTGRVGGGVSGINRTTFLADSLRRGRKLISYDNDRTAVLISPIKAPDLVLRISDFVKEVAEFKTSARTGNLRAPTTLQKTKGKLFKPKFTGTIKRKTTSSEKAKLLHDEVCAKLAELLPKKTCHYTRERDLYISAPNGTLGAIFEIKTDCSTTSVYTAVGQLLINGSSESTKATKRILVIPGKPKPSTELALQKLGISTIHYI